MSSLRIMIERALEQDRWGERGQARHVIEAITESMSIEATRLELAGKAGDAAAFRCVEAWCMQQT